MTAIAKSAKRRISAKKCCGWEEPAICPGNICHISLISAVTGLGLRSFVLKRTDKVFAKMFFILS